MKKQVLAIILAFAFSSLSAQLTSKKGEPYLPEQGDWSFGIDATPFLNYVGNMLSIGGNFAPTQQFLNSQQTIIGKYFVTENKAYRGILRIGLSSRNWTNDIGQWGATAPVYPALPTLVQDEYTEKSSFIGIGGGMEWRRGSTRLQGYYGGDLMISFSNSGRTYSYGNALNDTVSLFALTSSFADTSTNIPSNFSTDTYGNDGRLTEVKDGSSFGLTLRGFIGVEYFICPKISLAGEFGWGVSFMSMGVSSRSLESIGDNGTAFVVGEQTIESNSRGGFMVDTDRNLTGTTTGALRLNFHF
ncbi:MAG: hypothetical protein WED33_01935 [Bacteroidia bacterium]